MLFPSGKEAEALNREMHDIFNATLEGKATPFQHLEELYRQSGWSEQSAWITSIGQKQGFEVFDGNATGNSSRLVYILKVHTPEVDRRSALFLEDLIHCGYLDKNAVLVKEGESGVLEQHESGWMLRHENKLNTVRIKDKYFEPVASTLCKQGTRISFIDDMNCAYGTLDAEKPLENAYNKMAHDPSPRNKSDYVEELKCYITLFLTRVKFALLPGLLRELEQHPRTVAMTGLLDYTTGKIIPDELKKQGISYLAFIPKGPIKME